MKYFFCRLLSFLIDFCFIYILGFILSVFFRHAGLIERDSVAVLTIYTLLFLLYSLFTALNNGKSLGREWMSLKLESSGRSISKIKLFIRDFVLQWGLSFLIPSWILYWTKTHTYIIFILGSFLIVNVFTWLSLKKTLVDLISNTFWNIKPKSFKNNAGLSIAAFFIDISIIYSISLIIERTLLHFIFIETVIIFFIISFLYYIIFYLLFNRTLGKQFLGLKLTSKDYEVLTIGSIFKRELIFKFGLGFILPLFILLLLGWDDAYFIAALIVILNIWWGAIYYTVKKELWWDTLSKTSKVVIKNVGIKMRSTIYLILFIIWGTSYGLLLFFNNQNNSTEQKIFGFSYPFKFKEYPNNNKLHEYNQFLSDSLQSPENYILDLFDKYDIVILCENLHNEDTQWDMIYNTISNPRFITNVGNIFTEYGEITNQKKVDEFLQTTYDNNTTLEKATATLMRYFSGNFYFFMKKLHKLNQTLPDSLKIKEYFTDTDWKYLQCYKTTRLERQNSIKRDSLMAQTVIDWYQKYRKKCLVITNYRHAFAINQDAKKKNYAIWERYFSDNEAQYIYDAFPYKTANILIFGNSLKRRYIYEPIQQGKWKTAFKNNQYKPIGFNFKESPFGKDLFDLYSIGVRRINIKYQDVFTGLVFYKPEEQYKFSSPKYQKYAAEQELDYALKNNLVDSVNAKQEVENYMDLYGNNYYQSIVNFIYLYNYIDILVFILLLVIAFPIATWNFLKEVLRKQ